MLSKGISKEKWLSYERLDRKDENLKDALVQI